MQVSNREQKRKNLSLAFLGVLFYESIILVHSETVHKQQ
jgi:hypothetical protein